MPFDNKMLAALRAMGGTGGSGGGGSGGSEYFENGIIKQEALPEGFPYASEGVITYIDFDGGVVKPNNGVLKYNSIPEVGSIVTVSFIPVDKYGENWQDYAETHSCTVSVISFMGMELPFIGKGSLLAPLGIVADDVDDIPLCIMWIAESNMAMGFTAGGWEGLVRVTGIGNIFTPMIPDLLPKAEENVAGAVSGADVRAFVVGEGIAIYEGETTLEELYRISAYAVHNNMVANNENYFVYRMFIQSFSPGGNVWKAYATLYAVEFKNSLACKITVNFTGEELDSVVESIEIEYPSTGNLPPVTADNNGSFLRVVNGAWAIDSIPTAEEASF